MSQLEGSRGAPVTLLLKVDNGNVMQFSASLQPWNAHYAGFVASDRTYPIVQAVKAIASAQDTVGVGAEFLGNQQSDNFGASGSTSAMATVVNDCDLDAIKPDQAPGNDSQSGSASSQ